MDKNSQNLPDFALAPWSEQEIKTLSYTKPFSMTPPQRLINTMRAIEHVVKNNVSGSFVECGVWRGGNTMAAIETLISLGSIDREVFLYDTFDGMALPDERDLRIDGVPALSMLQAEEKTLDSHMWGYTPIDIVKNNVLSLGYPENKITFVKGKVEETIPGTLPSQIAVLRLDTDWYLSTIHELEHLYPLLSPGGVLIVDDYGLWTGSKQAVDEYFATLDIAPTMVPINDDCDNSAIYCIKPLDTKVVSRDTTSTQSSSNKFISNKCPITGSTGVLLSERDPEQLFESYASYFGAPIAKELKEKYFKDVVYEYQSPESGLRWYSPSIIGGADFYENLGATYPWYYRDQAWDKDVICEILATSGISLFLDYGCGNGSFLYQTKLHGMEGWGVDINPKALADAQKMGVEVYNLNDIPNNHPSADVVTILQTVEHVADPVNFLKDIIRKFDSKVFILSAPCHETLLGNMKDPLSWPPHHISMWSEKAFESLAKAIGFKLTGTVREPLTLERCEGMLKMEGSREPRGLPRFPTGDALAPFIENAKSRGADWAKYSHSIVAILEKQ